MRPSRVRGRRSSERCLHGFDIRQIYTMSRGPGQARRLAVDGDGLRTVMDSVRSVDAVGAGAAHTVRKPWTAPAAWTLPGRALPTPPTAPPILRLGSPIRGSDRGWSLVQRKW